MVDRLAKMESVTEDFSRPKSSTSPSNSLDNELQPSPIKSIEAGSSERRASGLVFERMSGCSDYDLHDEVVLVSHKAGLFVNGVCVWDTKWKIGNFVAG